MDEVTSTADIIRISIKKLSSRVLYYNIDSYIYVRGEPNKYEPCTGNFLGDMTDELESYGRDSFIELLYPGAPTRTSFVYRKIADIKFVQLKE